jgi:hypothetical protein
MGAEGMRELLRRSTSNVEIEKLRKATRRPARNQDQEESPSA